MAYYVHTMAFCGTSGFILLLWFIEMEAAFHVSVAIINRFVEPSSSCHTSYWNHQPKLSISQTAVQFIFKAKAIGTTKTFVSLQLFLSPSAFQFHLTHPYTPIPTTYWNHPQPTKELTVPIALTLIVKMNCSANLALLSFGWWPAPPYTYRPNLRTLHELLSHTHFIS
jgi:hypothetical protein